MADLVQLKNDVARLSKALKAVLEHLEQPNPALDPDALQFEEPWHTARLALRLSSVDTDYDIIHKHEKAFRALMKEWVKANRTPIPNDENGEPLPASLRPKPSTPEEILIDAWDRYQLNLWGRQLFQMD